MKRTPQQSARWQQVAAKLPEQKPRRLTRRDRRDPSLEMLNTLVVPQSGMHEITAGSGK